MKILACVLYYGIATKLPLSFLPGGFLYNYFRIMCLRGFVSIGKGCKVQSNVFLGRGRNISIGDYCQINQNVRIANARVGSYVMMAPGVVVLGRAHRYSDPNIPMVLQGEVESAQTLIEDDVWLGANSVVLPGLKVSQGTILGAGSVLTRDTEPYGIYGGVPARLIRRRPFAN